MVEGRPGGPDRRSAGERELLSRWMFEVMLPTALAAAGFDDHALEVRVPWRAARRAWLCARAAQAVERRVLDIAAAQARDAATRAADALGPQLAGLVDRAHRAAPHRATLYRTVMMAAGLVESQDNKGHRIALLRSAFRSI